MRLHSFWSGLRAGSIALVCAAPVAAEDLMAVHDLARQSDPTLMAAQARLSGAKLNDRLAMANFYPSVNASASRNKGTQAQSINGTSVGDLPDTSSETMNLSLSQSLYRRDNYLGLRKARKQVRQGEVDYAVVHQDFLVRVARSYFDVLTQTDNLRFSQAEEKAIERQLEQARQRFEVGLAAITDVHEARAQYDNARAAVIQAQNVLDDAREALTEITSREIMDVNPLRAKLPLQQPAPNNREEWVEIAREHNPNLDSLRLAMEISDLDVDLANAAHYPTLSFTASRGKTTSGDVSFNTGAGFSDPFDLDSYSTNYSLEFNLPLYAGGAVVTRARQAAYGYEAARDTFEATQRSVVRTARSGYRGTLAAIAQVEARSQAVLSAQSALEATEAGFEVGTRTIVDVLLSQRNLFQAQRNHSQARHDYILNHLTLRRTAGTLSVTDLQEVNALLDGT